MKTITNIKVLGSGCKNCHTLYENAQEAVKAAGLNVEVDYMEVNKMDNKKLNEKELEEVVGGAHNTVYIPGLETIGPYAVAAQRDMPAPPPGSYSEAERELISENTETVLK